MKADIIIDLIHLIHHIPSEYLEAIREIASVELLDRFKEEFDG